MGKTGQVLGTTLGLAGAGTALYFGQPELVAPALGAGSAIGNVGGDYIEKKMKKSSKKGKAKKKTHHHKHK